MVSVMMKGNSGWIKNPLIVRQVTVELFKDGDFIGKKTVQMILKGSAEYPVLLKVPLAKANYSSPLNLTLAETRSIKFNRKRNFSL